MAWYEDWFERDEYELVYRNRNQAEAEQMIALLLETALPTPGASILDVGCGRGRHARSLARRGYTVTGLDLSERALDMARSRAAEAGLAIDFVQGDMRDPVCDGCFDGVVNLFTAFGYFEDDGDHLKALAAMATAVKPGGWVFQDFLNATYVRNHFVPANEREAGGVLIHERRWLEDGRINKAITLEESHGYTHTFRESVRLLTYEDLVVLYGLAGLTLEATFGHYDGRGFGPDTPRLILLARRTG